MKHKLFLTNLILLTSLFIPVAGRAQLLMDVGSLQLQPGQSSQSLDLLIQNTGASPISSLFGLNFALQIGTGIAGPKVTAVDLAAGNSIFSSSSINQTDQGSSSWVLFYGIDTGGSGVSLSAHSSSLLARLTFDTTGLTSGSWPLSLSSVGPLHSATEYILVGGTSRPIDTINSGTITVVPEPRLYSLAVCCGLLFFGFLNSRRLS